MKMYIPIIFVFIFISCKRDLKADMNKDIQYKGKTFFKDYYYVDSKNERIHKESDYINITNDTLFLLTVEFGGMSEKYPDCYRVWTIGVLNKKKGKTPCLNEECFIEEDFPIYLETQTKSIDTINNEIIYNFDILSGSITYGEVEIKLLFSRERGIINLIENDTIYIPPFF